MTIRLLLLVIIVSVLSVACGPTQQVTDLETANASLTQQVSELTADLEAAQSTLATGTEDLDALRSSLSEAEDHLGVANQERQALSTTLEETRIALTSAEQTIATLETDLASSVEAQAELTSENESLQANNASLSQDLAAANAALSELEETYSAQLSARQTRVAELAVERADLESQLGIVSEQAEQVDTLTAELNKVSNLNESQKLRTAQLAVQRTDLESSLNTFRAQAASAEEQLALTRNDLELSQADLETVRASLNETSEQLDLKLAEVDSLTAELAATTALYEEAEAKSQALNSELNQVSAVANSVQNTLTSTQEELNALSNELTTMVSQEAFQMQGQVVDRIQQRNTELAVELTSLEARRDGLLQELSNLTNAKASLDAELLASQAIVNEQEQLISTYQSQLEERQLELSEIGATFINLRSQYASTAAALEASGNQEQILTAQLSAMETQVTRSQERMTALAEVIQTLESQLGLSTE